MPHGAAAGHAILRYGNVTFTGTLSDLTRDGAEQVVRDMGGTIRRNFCYRRTHVLVVGRMPKSGPTEALRGAQSMPDITILDEADFINLIPHDILARHHRKNTPDKPSDDETVARSIFHAFVASAAEEYMVRCVRDFISNDLPGQKNIELDHGCYPPLVEFVELSKLVVPLVRRVPRTSPVVKEVRETLAEHNLKLFISNADNISPGLRFQVLDKRRFLQDANQFIEAGLV